MLTLLKNSQRPDITFCRNGKICLSAKVARILGLTRGDTINIAVTHGPIPCHLASDRDCTCQPETRRNCRQAEYLLFRVSRSTHSSGLDGALCYPVKKGDNSYRANSVLLCRSLMASVGLDVHRVAFRVGDPVSYNSTLCLPIITLHPLLR